MRNLHFFCWKGGVNFCPLKVIMWKKDYFFKDGKGGETGKKRRGKNLELANCFNSIHPSKHIYVQNRPSLTDLCAGSWDGFNNHKIVSYKLWKINYSLQVMFVRFVMCSSKIHSTPRLASSLTSINNIEYTTLRSLTMQKNVPRKKWRHYWEWSSPNIQHSQNLR